MSSWTDSMIEPQAKQFAGATQNANPLLPAETGMIFNIWPMTFNLTITPSLKVKLCWSNAAAYAKSIAFCNLCLWCDLWLGSLVCSIWSFIDLRSPFTRDWGGFVTEMSQKTKQRVLCFVFSTDFRGKGVHFIQKPLTEPRNLKKVQPPKNARQFFVSGWWSMAATPDDFLLLWIAWVWNQRRVKRFPCFKDHHNLFSTKTSLNKDDPKTRSQPTCWWMPLWPSNYFV